MPIENVGLAMRRSSATGRLHPLSCSDLMIKVTDAPPETVCCDQPLELYAPDVLTELLIPISKAINAVIKNPDDPSAPTLCQLRLKLSVTALLAYPISSVISTEPLPNGLAIDLSSFLSNQPPAPPAEPT